MKVQKYKWDLNQLFKGLDDPSLEKTVEDAVIAWTNFVNNYKGKDIVNNIAILKSSLEDYSKIYTTHNFGDKSLFYLNLLASLDSVNPKIKAKRNILTEKVTNIINSIQFFELQIGKINISLQNKILTDTNFTTYQTFLKRIWKTSLYNLSEPEEKILNKVSKTSSSNWKDMSSTFRSTITKIIQTQSGEKEVTLSEIPKYLDSEFETVRRSASEANKSIRKDLSQMAEFELNSILEFKRKVETLRGIDDPELLRLSRDDLDKSVVDSMITAVNESFDIPKKFFEVKAKALSKSKLEVWDLNTQIGKLDKKYLNPRSEFAFDESVQIVHNTLAALDNEFVSIFDNAVNESRIDAFPYKGKKGGAFCTVFSKSTPSYILMNAWENTSDITTLAHEVGHMIHFEMSRGVDQIYYDFSLASAEVASTFFEDFAFSLSLLQQTDPNIVFGDKMEKMFDIISTIHMQIAGYNFERNLHREAREKGYISAVEMNQLMHNELIKFYGDITDVSYFDDRWVTWPHLRTPFYMYSYAFGLLISKSLQVMVREDKSNIEKVKTFLRMGNTLSPKEIFATIGIDISNKGFWEKGLQQIRQEMNELESMIL
jgi:oligoendopeptidase F